MEEQAEAEHAANCRRHCAIPEIRASLVLPTQLALPITSSSGQRLICHCVVDLICISIVDCLTVSRNTKALFEAVALVKS